MRKLVIVVTLVNEYMVHYNLGSLPNLAANIERKLSKGFFCCFATASIFSKKEESRLRDEGTTKYHELR